MANTKFPFHLNSPRVFYSASNEAKKCLLFDGKKCSLPFGILLLTMPFQIRERRGGALPGALEQGRERAQVERQSLQLRNLLRLRGAMIELRGWPEGETANLRERALAQIIDSRR
jgi:hypothetical protein